ncbi:MAG TPA: MFS transporter [Chloroflexota bacterium]|nr:MFS transporter [Chloroflexota bacterium]
MISARAPAITAPRGAGWGAIALMCLSVVGPASNYTNHGPLIPLIAADLALTPAQAGLMSTAFFTGLLLTALVVGYRIDRDGGKRVLVPSYVVLVAGNLLLAVAPNLALLLFAKFVAGLGAGACFTAGLSYTRVMAPPGRRFLAQGLFGGTYLAISGSTVYVMPALAEPLGWRGAVLLAGLVIAAIGATYALFAPRDPGIPTPGGVFYALRNRDAWILSFVHMCGFGLAMVMATWAAVFLVHDEGLPLQQASLLGSLVLLGGVVWRPLGGALVDRRVIDSLRLMRLALVVCIGGLIWLALGWGGLAGAVLGLLVVGLGTSLPYAAVFNGAALSVPESPASAQALVGWAGAFLVLLGPPVVGALLEATGSFAAGYVALAAFAVATLILTRWLALGR